MIINKVAYSATTPIHTEIMSNGDLLVVGDKARIERKNGNITGLCLDLRHYYDRNNGFIERKTRTDKEVIILGKVWADKHLTA